jgi:hypothetical protein
MTPTRQEPAKDLPLTFLAAPRYHHTMLGKIEYQLSITRAASIKAQRKKPISHQ